MAPAPKPGAEKVAGGLGEAARHAEQQQWAATDQRLQTLLASEHLPAELRPPLVAAQAEAGRLKLLEAASNALADGEGGYVLALAAADLDRLPPAVRSWAVVERLRGSLAGGAPKAPNLPQIESDLASLARADPRLARRTRDALAARSGQEGNSTVADRLRDLKFDPEPPGPPLPMKPPGPAPQVPEGPDGASAAVKEPARAGLPPLQDELAQFARKARTQARDAVRGQTQVNGRVLNHLLSQASRQLAVAQGKRPEHAEEKEAPEDVVRKLLGRELTPTDRVFIRHLRSKGKTPAEIAKVLNELDVQNGASGG